VRDTVNMLQQGVPAVGLVHEPFEKLAKMQAVQLGMPEAPLLIYPQDLPSKDPAELVRSKALSVSERMLAMLLGQRGREGGA
jgi:hypothetical protein